MRRPACTAASMLLASLSFAAAAAEPLIEPHAMLYYRFSFDRPVPASARSSFGFRMDNLAVAPDGAVDYAGLLRRPAVLDVRFNRRGLQSLSVSGRDYLQRTRIYHRQNGSGAEAETDTETAAGREQSAPEKVFAEVSGIVVDEVSSEPVGFAIGAVFGLALWVGVGD